MTSYCANTVVFSGDNQKKALQYFAALPENSPPFLAILIYDNALHFDSRWIPPLRDLDAVAEQFNVSYNLQYQIPYEEKASYQYTCLQHHPLSQEGDNIRREINEATELGQMEHIEAKVHNHLHSQSLDQHQLIVLSHLLGKKFNELGTQAAHLKESSTEVIKPWEGDDANQQKQRGR